jgi:hypothetical protein
MWGLDPDPQDRPFPNIEFRISVGDPEPDPQDPHVFGPLGSGSISQRCRSGSGSGSVPFLINVLSGLKECLQNNILTQNYSKKFNFYTEDTVMHLWASYETKM